MFNIIIAEDYNQVSSEAFRIVRSVMNQKDPVLGLATGSSPIGLYKKMIADHHANGTSYKNCVTFNLDEYIGLEKNHEQSYWTFMHENLFDSIDIEEGNIHIPCGCAEDMEAECKRYEDLLNSYTVDLQILGIGSDGHIGFNEPGTPFESVTHITQLTEQTRQDNARFFDDDISQNKADAVYGMIQGPMDLSCPASVLQKHMDVTVILDQAAAARL